MASQTPGPSWRFELLLGTCAVLLIAAAVLAPHLHLHLIRSAGLPHLMEQKDE
jgi:hypothetical protein